MQDDMQSYRNYILEAEQKSIESYDKAILTLTAGGLGVTLTFINSAMSTGHVQQLTLLFYGWGCWVFAIIVILLSFYCSHLALRKTIKQIDDKSIHNSTPGGYYSTVINYCNVFSGLFFIAGLVLVLTFTYININEKISDVTTYQIETKTETEENIAD